MDWREATSASGERPAVHPDCRRPIKISYVILSLSPDHRLSPHLSLNYFYYRITVRYFLPNIVGQMMLSYRIKKRVK